MGRPRGFDDATVLTAAMHAFRREGWGRSSVSGLESATGLRTSSLYNAFGDKAGLFRAALDHYVTTLVAPRLAAFAGPEATLDDLEQLFLTLFDPPFDDGYGCLVVNSAVEFGSHGFGSHESVAREGVERGLGLVEQHVADVLRRELGHAAQAETSALVLLYQGLLVQTRRARLDAGHRTAVHHHFDALRHQKEHRP